jgi:anaerobic magnesium-protoporphyrin IX monomethyl ester cyclase
VTTAVDKGLKAFYFRPSYLIRFALKNQHWQDFTRKLRGFKHFMSYMWENRKKNKPSLISDVHKS